MGEDTAGVPDTADDTTTPAEGDDEDDILVPAFGTATATAVVVTLPPDPVIVAPVTGVGGEEVRSSADPDEISMECL